MLHLKLLNENNLSDLLELQTTLEAAPSHWKLISGKAVSPSPAKEVFESLLTGKTLKDKFVFGLILENEYIVCVDLIRGYPNESTAILGLLLLKESHQNSGLGKAAYRLIEQWVQNWQEISKIRIGVIALNESVFHFL